MREMNNTQETEWLLRDKYNGEKTDEFFSDVKRIENGEPVDYVIGFSKFLGCKIDLSFEPLIPRTETEYWVEIAINEIKQKYGDKSLNILDIFSGSGCIGIAVLKYVPNSKVTFSDIDENMILQIKKNLEINNIDESRYQLVKSDIFEHIEKQKFDVVFANPPYIDKQRNITDKSVIDNEPHKALFAENHGMEIIEKFLKQAVNYMSDNGAIYLEHDDDQVERIKSLLDDKNSLKYEFFKDQFGLHRFAKVLIDM